MLSAPIFLIFCLLLSFPLAMTYYTYAQSPVPTQGLRQLPQDYSITTYPPAGVPQQSIFGFDINNLISMLGGSSIGGAISTFLAKIFSKKNEQQIKETKQEVAVVKEQTVAVKQTNQELAQNQVKQMEVQEQHLNLTYDTMPQKGNEIQNKPVLKQDNIKELKDKTIKTAAKA